MTQDIPMMWMRGGTSKGGFFLASDLPRDPMVRDPLLLRVMGTPDPRQIDGIGGGDPLTSKVAVIQNSNRAGVDIDYLFLQVFVDEPIVSDAQNCGNLLAAVGPFAIERGLVAAQNEHTKVTIFMENTGQVAVAQVPTPQARVQYDGTTKIDGVPGTAPPIAIEMRDTAGSTCGALFPTENKVDVIDGVRVTLIDNGMPCVVLRAADMGIDGTETPAMLDANLELRARLEAIRHQAGPMMNLGDVSAQSVPKMAMLSPPKNGGAISTRTFIPYHCHKTIGVFGAITVATAILTPGTVGQDLAVIPDGSRKALMIEHPTGEMTVVGHVENGEVVRTEILRTARKIMDGVVFPAPLSTTQMTGDT